MFSGHINPAFNRYRAVKAINGLIFTGVPSDEQIFTINGRIYELDTDSTAATGGDVLVDITGAGTADQFCTAIADGINADSSRVVDAVADLDKDIVWLFARTAGSAGNALTLTEGLSNATAMSATFRSGADEKPQETMIVRHVVTTADASRGTIKIKTEFATVLGVSTRIEDAGVPNNSPDNTYTISGGLVTLVEGSTPAWAADDVLIVEIVGIP